MRSNAEIVQDIYGDAPLPLDAATLDRWYEHAWDPDIEWRAIEGAPDDVGVMHGRDRLRRYYDEWQELFEDMTFDLKGVTEVGDQVVLTTRVTGRSRSTGMDLMIDYAQRLTFSDGRILCGREYLTEGEALAVAAQAAERAPRPG